MIGSEEGKNATDNKLGRACLSHSWPKPVFSFKGSIGHLPVESRPYGVVSRKIPATGCYKVVPEVLYPIQANRQPVPRHEMLEDDYRAVRNTILNQLILRQKFQPNEARPIPVTHLYSPVDINAILWSGRAEEVKDQLPELLAYNPGMTPPPGYMYQVFNQGVRARKCPPKKNEGSWRFKRPPVVSIRGPFQNMVNLRALHQDDVNKFDPAVIGKTRSEEIRIYNEPDAVSSLAIKADFGRPLSERARCSSLMVKKATQKKIRV
ncbi:hypothetical protein PoB_007562800 [Plakobranchus ocellatus]|uniref:Uncharacterized protein n=1 Tax=Plakobranchus ocellatus TaxID=259542 RepID=A0AAV4DXN8_9GAST|nr:hypothetical protein PoB_007562800 [Plakobranchus ocellatus]